MILPIGNGSFIKVAYCTLKIRNVSSIPSSYYTKRVIFVKTKWYSYYSTCTFYDIILAWLKVVYFSQTLVRASDFILVVCFFFPLFLLDYDEKAEDAVNYEDIDEQYEGPEIQAATEEDYLLPKKEYFSADVSVASLDHSASVFDDDNYDEDEEFEKEHEVVDNNSEVQAISSGLLWDLQYLLDSYMLVANIF